MCCITDTQSTRVKSLLKSCDLQLRSHVERDEIPSASGYTAHKRAYTVLPPLSVAKTVQPACLCFDDPADETDIPLCSVQLNA